CKISRSDTSSVLTKQFPSHRFLKMSRIIYNPLLHNGEVMRCFIRLLVSVNLIYQSSIECQSPMYTTIVYYVLIKSVISKSSRFQGKESERDVIKLLAYSITSGCSSCLFSCLFNKIYNPYAVAKTKTAPTKYMAKKPLADITIPQIKAPEAIPKS